MSFLRSACVVVLLVGAIAAPAAAVAFDPSGHWQITTGESRYRVARCGKAGREFCAKLTWLRKDARTEANLALLNKTIVHGRPADENTWTGTVVYDGQTYEATVVILSDNSMRVHGCSGMFCKTFELRRL